MRIDELPAGREMDKAISRYVFGNNEFVCRNCEDDYHIVDRQGLIAYIPVSNYSTDIAAAWEVEEKLMELDKILEYLEALQIEANGTEKGLTLTNKIIGYTYNFEEIFNLIHATPAQRCRAALKTLEVTLC